MQTFTNIADSGTEQNIIEREESHETNGSKILALPASNNAHFFLFYFRQKERRKETKLDQSNEWI